MLQRRCNDVVATAMCLLGACLIYNSKIRPLSFIHKSKRHFVFYSSEKIRLDILSESSAIKCKASLSLVSTLNGQHVK